MVSFFHILNIMLIIIEMNNVFQINVLITLLYILFFAFNYNYIAEFQVHHVIFI